MSETNFTNALLYVRELQMEGWELREAIKEAASLFGLFEAELWETF